MPAIFVSPGVYVTEQDASLYLRNLSTTVCALVGTAPRGPVNEPTLITNVNAFTLTFGQPNPNHLAMYSAMEYLRYGNQLYYTRVNGSSSATAEIAINGAATYAELLSDPGPFQITAAAAARVVCTVDEPFNITATNKFLKLQINGGPIIDITLSEGGAVDAAAVAAEIDAAITSYGATAAEVGSHLEVYTDTTGSTTSITAYAVTNSAYALLGWPPIFGTKRSDYGTDSTQDLRVTDILSGTPTNTDIALTVGTRTAAQVVTDLQTLLAGRPIDIDVYDGRVRMRHQTIGQTAGLQIGGSTANFLRSAVNLGFDNDIHYGTGLSPASETMKVLAGSSGEWGNLLSVAVATGSASGSFKLTVYEDGAAVESFDNLVGHPDQEDSDLGTVYFLTAINGTGASSASRYIAVEDTLTNTGNPVNGTYILVGGVDGLSDVSDDDFVGTVSGLTRTGLQIYANAEQIDVNILAVPGIHSAAVIAEMISICEARGDCFALVDPPLGLGVQQVVDWHNGANVYSDHSAFNSSYAGLYWPWLQVYDASYDRYIWTPPSGHLAAIMAYNDQVAYPWFAPAGLNRGRVLQVTDLEDTADQGDRDLMYGGNNAVNPIVNFSRDGITVWGQRTLQRKPSALDRINVRRMMLYVRKVIASSVRGLVFEPNDPQTWRSFVAAVDPFMRGLVAKRGVIRYRIVCDETTNTPDHIDNNEMVAKIFIEPTKAAEKILVDAVLTPTGASFEESIL